MHVEDTTREVWPERFCLIFGAKYACMFWNRNLCGMFVPSEGNILQG
jgi:hypothetical protein